MGLFHGFIGPRVYPKFLKFYFPVFPESLPFPRLCLCWFAALPVGVQGLAGAWGRFSRAFRVNVGIQAWGRGFQASGLVWGSGVKDPKTSRLNLSLVRACTQVRTRFGIWISGNKNWERGFEFRV